MPRRIFEQPAFSLFLFALALGLFIGPLAIVPRGNVTWSFLHLFGSWLLVIGIHFIASLFHKMSNTKKGSRDV